MVEVELKMRDRGVRQPVKRVVREWPNGLGWDVGPYRDGQLIETPEAEVWAATKTRGLGVRISDENGQFVLWYVTDSQVDDPNEAVDLAYVHGFPFEN